ncbi:MAG: hypothetical protein WCO98_09560 [bacterium]
MKFVKFLSVIAVMGLLTVSAFSDTAAGAAPTTPATTTAAPTTAPAEKPAKPVKPAPKPLDVSKLKAVTVKGTVKLVVVDPAKNPRLAKNLEFQLIGDATTTVMAGPKEYIEKTIGLKLADGATAEVAGWEKVTTKATVVIAKTITVDTKVYTLRDDKGVSVWEAEQLAKFKELTKDELAKADIVTVAGPAKLPEGVPANEPSFTRFAVDDKTIVLIAPKKVVDALGIVVKEGDTLKATGWKVVRGEKTFVLARELTVNDKFYNLRDFDGKIIKPKTDKPAKGDKPGRGAKQKTEATPKTNGAAA